MPLVAIEDRVCVLVGSGWIIRLPANAVITPTQRDADAALVQHPHRLELRGAPRALRWPDRCANCGAPAVERLPVAKAFYPQLRWTSRNPSTRGYRVVRAAIPVCEPCAARHRGSLQPQTWFSRYRSFILNPVHIATLGLAALFWVAAPAVRDLSSRPDSARIAIAIAAAFLLAIAWTLGLAWWTTRPDRFPRTSEITSACDFSQDVSSLFERERHIYRIRDGAFADDLSRLNSARVWTDADQKGTRWRALAGLAALIAALLVARWLLGSG